MRDDFNRCEKECFTKRKKMISLVTHGGMYHADDVLATALLEIILK